VRTSSGGSKRLIKKSSYFGNIFESNQMSLDILFGFIRADEFETSGSQVARLKYQMFGRDPVLAPLDP